MDMRRTTLALLMALALAAQPGLALTPPLPGSDPDPCNSAAFLHLIGQPESALKAETIPDPWRLIRFGEFVTQDYSESRLNVQLDVEGRIERLSCG
ncbi:MAG: I78 family peptidase inhibitor [Phaeovulum sp.]|jgi:hypothetical protein|uniref:I78 family peptidase inhibitor n=1 Tax=Phaeovulum sp. TaxID=2934796 RepID=UPI0027320721|nr:I78 family peptidase inhibitor [Phaeovulum sp.]MDP2061492.1 I78 family peptidase inhibitor [Phaeovulum sp.]MDP3860274.1 I78 family peptidase inhibitor [Phaeovulum sp.]